MLRWTEYSFSSAEIWLSALKVAVSCGSLLVTRTSSSNASRTLMTAEYRSSTSIAAAGPDAAGPDAAGPDAAGPDDIAADNAEWRTLLMSASWDFTDCTSSATPGGRPEPIAAALAVTSPTHLSVYLYCCWYDSVVTLETKLASWAIR